MEIKAKPKVCVIYSYPAGSAHGQKILEVVSKTLGQEGVAYDIVDLYLQNFNPTLSEHEAKMYGQSVPVEIARQQNMIKAADVIIFAYPVWWSAPPAILKGYIDRVFTPGFAYLQEGGHYKPLLGSKRALVLRTFSVSAEYEHKLKNPAKICMEGAVLEVCGIKSSAIEMYSVGSLAPSAFLHSLTHLEGAVRRALATPTGVPHRLRSIPAPYLPPIEERKAPQEEISDVDGKDAKPKLSKQAQDDLKYFQSARRQAREAVHRRSDRNEATRYMFASDDSDFHPKGYRYTGRIAEGGAYGAKMAGSAREGGRLGEGERKEQYGRGKYGWRQESGNSQNRQQGRQMQGGPGYGGQGKHEGGQYQGGRESQYGGQKHKHGGHENFRHKKFRGKNRR